MDLTLNAKICSYLSKKKKHPCFFVVPSTLTEHLDKATSGCQQRSAIGCSFPTPGCVQGKVTHFSSSARVHNLDTSSPRQEEHSPLCSAIISARNQPGCLSEKDAVLCYQHPVEDVCCPVQPQPRCIPRRRHGKMQHPSTYIISTCQGFSSHLSEEKSSLLHIFKVINPKADSRPYIFDYYNLTLYFLTHSSAACLKLEMLQTNLESIFN